jgi:hypothetical protein
MTTPEQIQQWARDAGFDVDDDTFPKIKTSWLLHMERFAALARADLEAENADLTAQMADQGPYINKLRDKINSLRDELFAVRVHGKHEATKRVLAKLSELKAQTLQDAADAARYRWIRRPDNLFMDVWVIGLSDDVLDKRIDAEMKETL